MAKTDGRNGQPGNGVGNTITYIWGYRINTLILLVHVGLLLFFFIQRIPAMAVVNCFSVTCYFLEYSIIKRSPVVFLWVFFAEVLVHMSLAVYFVGWDCGFQYYLFALSAVVFFFDHAVQMDGFKSLHPLVVALVILVDFVSCAWIGFNGEPVYAMNGAIVNRLNIVNGIMILILLSVCSLIYVERVLTIETELTQNAELDQLTSLPNRHGLERVLEERGIGARGGQSEYAAAILDLDDFKKVNDRFGHLAGDQVLRKMAVTLKGIEADNIFVARWGGEEFIALVYGADAYRILCERMEMIRAQVEATVVFFENWRLRETVSIGVSGTTESLPFKELVEEADACLYQAKGSGKNRVIGKWG